MFEGSEKKVEVVFSPNSPSLFEQPAGLWKKIVQACGAEIISCSKFPKIHSYILSESSLFVWAHRLVLITCGKTELSKTLIKILKNFPQDFIEVCFFQRKNELFPQIQKSCFHKDLQKIKRKVAGKAYRFGSLHDHHFFLFHSETDFTPSEQDQTLEILIYDSEILKDSSPQTIFHLKKELAKVFYGFEIQEHFFTPFGYSLNAVRDNFYYTVHITPEKSFFYTSFETNIKESVQILTNKILNVFKPLKFDLIFFESHSQSKKFFESQDYFSSSNFYQVLDCGYIVIYKNFHKNNLTTQSPLLIKEDNRQMTL